MGALDLISKGIDIETLDNKIIAGTQETRQIVYETKSLWSRLTTDEENKLREAAVKAKLIPVAYKNAKFDSEMIKNRVNAEMRKKAKMDRYRIRNYKSYVEVCNGILATLGMGEDVTQSYVIGAPNGFGKTSFANDAILRLFSRGVNVAPYVSLTELAEIKMANDTRLAKGLVMTARGVNNDDKAELNRFVQDGYNWDIEKIYEMHSEPVMYSKIPVDIVGRYSWSEYINAEVLFTYFTSIDSKVLESKMLQHLLYVRGTKGLPTIAMISTALTPYINDPTLAELVWDEIYDKSTSEAPCYDRVKHVSCFKDRRKLYMNSNEDAEEYVD